MSFEYFETKTFDPGGVGKWQVNDGYSWTHYFETAEEAESFARKMNVNTIGQLKEKDGHYIHSPVRFIEEWV